MARRGIFDFFGPLELYSFFWLLLVPALAQCGLASQASRISPGFACNGETEKRCMCRTRKNSQECAKHSPDVQRKETAELCGSEGGSGLGNGGEKGGGRERRKSRRRQAAMQRALDMYGSGQGGALRRHYRRGGSAYVVGGSTHKEKTGTGRDEEKRKRGGEKERCGAGKGRGGGGGQNLYYDGHDQQAEGSSTSKERPGGQGKVGRNTCLGHRVTLERQLWRMGKGACLVG